MADDVVLVSIRSLISLLALGLLVSVGLNVWQLISRPGAGSKILRQDGGSSAAAVSTSAGAQQTHATDELVECRRKLEICERRLKLGPLALSSFARSRPSPSDENEGSELGPDQDVLCSVARAHVKQLWLEKKDEIVFVLRNTLANDNLQEEDIQTAVDRYSEGLGLSDAERERFGEAYRDARFGRIDNIRDALDQDPPDFKRVLEQVKALHADEDRLTEDMFGEEAKTWLRDAEKENRSSLLAIAATYADVEWEEAVADE